MIKQSTVGCTYLDHVRPEVQGELKIHTCAKQIMRMILEELKTVDMERSVDVRIHIQPDIFVPYGAQYIISLHVQNTPDS